MNVAALRRPDGRAAVRELSLVLPSVVCATRVAERVAGATGATTITHQHGCSQVGDDGVRTAAAFTGIACGPNVLGVVVVGLGCETVQGSEVEAAIRARGQLVERVGIQELGGSARTVDAGVEAVERLRRSTSWHDAAIDAAELVLGVEVSRPSALAAELVERAASAGMGVVLADPSALEPPPHAVREWAFAAAVVPGETTLLEGGGIGPQQHVALAAAGAHAIVSFPALNQTSVGFPTCPVVAVGADDGLHAALRDDFDTAESDGFDQLWRVLIAVLSGTPSAVETLGRPAFALPRIARTM